MNMLNFFNLGKVYLVMNDLNVGLNYIYLNKKVV